MRELLFAAVLTLSGRGFCAEPGNPGAAPGKVGVTDLTPPAAAGKTMELTQEDNNTTVFVKSGDRIQVSLNDPGGGGYEMLPPVFDAKMLKLEKTAHNGPAADKPGDFGVNVYNFVVMAPGAGDLVFSAKRSWETEATVLLRVTLTVKNLRQVKPAPKAAKPPAPRKKP